MPTSRPLTSATRAAAIFTFVLILACGSACTSAPAPPPAPPPRQAVKAPSPTLPATESARSKRLTAEARFLAGVSGELGAPLSAMAASPEWERFAREMAGLRSLQEKRRMSKVRPWAEANLAEARKASETVLYPFGGPDAVYPVNLFPGAKTYVLVGLESCGKELDPGTLPPKEAARLLEEILKLVRPFYQASYFITKDMQAELRGLGVAPVLMLFLAGDGASIVEASPATIDGAGNLVRLVPGSTVPKGSVRGFAVDFVRAPSAPVQTLLYFSQNLADDGLAKHPEFVTFLGSQSNPSTFLKAASYLLWNREFKTLRELLLARSLAVLGDDSGVPYRYFNAGAWDVRLFGRYVEPVDPFQRSKQADLKKAYEEGGAVPVLDFSMGYHRQPAHCNLQFALRRSVAQASDQAAAARPKPGAS